MKLSVLILLLFFCVFGPLPTSALNKDRLVKCPSDYGFQGSYNFAKKEKSFVSIRKLSEISPTIRAEIEAQLIARVGRHFFNRLKFDFGNLHDFDSDALLLANDESRIDGYDLVFKFSDKAKGLKAYYFKVVADGNGKLLAELALPNIAASPQKANLIPCKQALKIAERNGFPKERSSIYIDYDWDSENLVWEVHDSLAVEPDQPFWGMGQGTYRQCYINSSTGEVIKIFKYTIIL